MNWKIKTYKHLTGKVKVLTGLRIGGGDAGMEIGGMDNPIIRLIDDNFRDIFPCFCVHFRKVGIRDPELRHLFEILNLGVKADLFARFKITDAAHIFIQMIALPLMNGDGEAIRFFSVQSCH